MKLARTFVWTAVAAAWLAASALLGEAHAAAAAAPASPAAPTPLALGAKAPKTEVAMKNVDGKPLTIAKAAGKNGTLVLFICNHCPWVKGWQARIAEVGNAALAQSVGVIAINANDPAAYPEDEFDVMVTRAKEVGYQFPYVVDATSDVARAFGATRTPEAFLFDAKGKLVYHGAIDDNAQHADQVTARWLNDAVAAVAAGKPVATGETKALGCGIKFRGSK
ncbi:MAG: thioredoxin family protein [Candidatus Eisenbacteria bacterium]